VQRDTCRFDAIPEISKRFWTSGAAREMAKNRTVFLLDVALSPPRLPGGINGSTSKATQQQRGLTINFCDIFRVVRFSAFATKSTPSGPLATLLITHVAVTGGIVLNHIVPRYSGCHDRPDTPARRSPPARSRAITGR
jgi:hypothetical protein